MTAKHPIVEITLNEPIKKLLASSPIEFTPSCLKDIDMCWYEIERRAAEPSLPTVVMKHGNTPLRLEHVTNITTVINGERGSEVQNLSLILRSIPSNSLHEEYRDFIYSLVENIKQAHWRHYYFPSDPRIPGTESNKIASPDDVFGSYVMSHPWLDPGHKIDLERWLKFGSFYNWYFYKEGAYLHLKAWRRDLDSAPLERATYLITLEFLTESDYWLSGFTEEEDRARWRELLPGRLEDYKQQRKELEDKARAAGIAIDESYQDPPIRALEN
ncbi:MAG TPA: hypothetical protein ENI17_12815 [Pseudomonas xinjiangensis]|uniref:Uncharacterized protein n=2 Tax=root TaxID=1 RepID=A0A7V1BNF7_9GAMM|nr:hypothetical protein [Halopseudomonas xinjiangensis]HEC48493.1 hypothetical protein [Halopseudomonas xinjiangensis]